MIRRFLPILAATALLLLSVSASAQEAPKARPPAWGPTHPFAIGVRTPMRIGDGYVQGGFGGHVRLRPYDRLRIELFFDNFFGQDGVAMRHDHEVGTTAQVVVLRYDRFIAYPMLGACAMLAMLDAGMDTPMVSDVRFGVHAGLGAEVAVGAGFSLQLQVETVGYFGHEMKAYDRTAFVDRTMRVYPTGQAELGLNYWF